MAFVIVNIGENFINLWDETERHQKTGKPVITTMFVEDTSLFNYGDEVEIIIKRKERNA